MFKNFYNVLYCSYVFVYVHHMNNEHLEEMPDPKVVARAAAEAVSTRMLEDYMEAINILREKKFTFREIADWLKKEFNIEADHNAVWRAYAKTVPADLAAYAAQEDDEIERDEAYRDAELNGRVATHFPVAEEPAKPQVPEKVLDPAPGRGAKMRFLREALTAAGSNRKTQAEIQEIYVKTFPDVTPTTAKNSVRWMAMDLKRKGITTTLLPKKVRKN